jgi:hypothetical protein
MGIEKLVPAMKILGHGLMYIIDEMAYTFPDEIEAGMRVRSNDYYQDQFATHQRFQARQLGKIARCYTQLGDAEGAAWAAKAAAHAYTLIEE